MQLFNSESGKLAYDLNRLALIPFGGSNVILTPFYKTLIGNLSDGFEVNHNLKSGWIYSFNSSQRRESSDIQLTAKWQFYSKTHPPFDYSSFIIFSAFLPYP